MTTDRAPRTEWPPGAGPPVPRGGPQRATADFEAVLDSQKAWTAPAGGHKKEPAKAPHEKQAAARHEDGVDPARKDDAAVAGAVNAADAATEAAPAAPAEEGVPVAPDSAMEAQPAAAAEAPAVAAQDVLAEEAPAPAAPVEAQVADSELPAGTASGAAKPAAPASAPAGAQAPMAPSAPVQAAVTTEAERGAAAPQTPQPSPATTRAAVQPAAGETPVPGEAPAEEQAPVAQGPRATTAAQPREARLPQAAPAAPESAPVVQPRPTVQAPQAPQAPASAPAQAPAATAGAGRALAQTAPTTLAGTVESVQATLRLAASHGVTRARLALHPAELGGVEVHLRSSAAGLVASVRADSPEAAKLLHQAAGQLRDALEEQGLTLLQLDIGSTGDRQVGAGAHRDERSAGTPGEPLATPDEDEPEVTASVRLPSGVLVDVLA